MLQYPRLSEGKPFSLSCIFLSLLPKLLLFTIFITQRACSDAFPRHPALCYRLLQLIFRSVRCYNRRSNRSFMWFLRVDDTHRQLGAFGSIPLGFHAIQQVIQLLFTIYYT